MDDRVYISLANDIVYMDRIFEKDYYGAYIGFDANYYKLLNTGWVEFMAMVAKTTGFHMLFVGKTLLSILLIVTFYLLMHHLFCELWKIDQKKRVIGLFATAFITESIRCVFALSTMQLYGTTFGKYIDGAIMAPLMILLFDRVMRETNWRPFVPLLILSGLACGSFSSAAVPAISFLLFFEMLVGFYRYRKMQVAFFAFCLEWPLLLQGIISLKWMA